MKVGLHYSLQTTQGQPARDVMAAALEDIAAAEKLGFSSIVFAERHFREDSWLPRPLLLAAAAAALTKRMRVGTDIVVLPLHHPVAVAEETAVVDVLSGGRAILAVGLGSTKSEYDGFGVPFDQRATIYGRSIEIVRALLAGKTVDSDGHYAFKGAVIRPLPVNPSGVPLWLGAVNDTGVRRAALSGDAWVMPPNNDLGRLVRQRELFRATRELAGLPPPMEQPLRREAFVAETDEEAWRLFAPGLRHQYGKVYRALHPTYPEHDDLNALRKFGTGLFVVGSPKTVADELRIYESALGITEFLVRYQLPQVPPSAIRESLKGLHEVLGILRTR